MNNKKRELPPSHKMTIQTKMQMIGQIESNLTLLNEDYKKRPLWGSAPDGDVSFGSLIHWLAENENLDIIVNTVKDLNKIN